MFALQSPVPVLVGNCAGSSFRSACKLCSLPTISSVAIHLSAVVIASSICCCTFELFTKSPTAAGSPDWSFSSVWPIRARSSAKYLLVLLPIVRLSASSKSSRSCRSLDSREVSHELTVKTPRSRRRIRFSRERRWENAGQIRPGGVAHCLSEVRSIANDIDDDLGAYRTFGCLSGVVDR